MPIATVTNFNNNVGSGIRLGPADHWDGYSENMVGNIFGGIFQGLNLNWGGFDMPYSNVPVIAQPYVGYNTNYASFDMPYNNIPVISQPYIGYNTNYGTAPEIEDRTINDTDIDSVINHPKDQTIYYKLKGWNSLTNSYESWVISQNITARPPLDGGLFDPIPGNEPPNVERDVFKTPPSGNTLSNIIIVARWIE